MTVITNIDTPLYKNYTTLIDGRYNVSLFERAGGSVPSKMAVVAGSDDDILNIDSFRELTTLLNLGAGNDFVNMAANGNHPRSGIIYGNDGDDTILCYNNIGVIYGDAGNDTLRAGVFAHGGEGDDDVWVGDTGYGGAGNDVVYARDNIAYGDAGDDVVTSRNVADGGDGNDVVLAGIFAIGGDGDDIVRLTSDSFFVSDGEGYVVGDAGNDRLFGGAGNNWMDGGTGKDIQTGGGGPDTFYFGKGDLGLSYATRDEITDFERGADKIYLTAYADAALSFDHTSKYDRIKIDTNGDQKTDFMIQVTVVDGHALTLDDLIL